MIPIKPIYRYLFYRIWAARSRVNQSPLGSRQLFINFFRTVLIRIGCPRSKQVENFLEDFDTLTLTQTKPILKLDNVPQGFDPGPPGAALAAFCLLAEGCHENHRLC